MKLYNKNKDYLWFTQKMLIVTALLLVYCSVFSVPIFKNIEFAVSLFGLAVLVMLVAFFPTLVQIIMDSFRDIRNGLGRKR